MKLKLKELNNMIQMNLFTLSSKLETFDDICDSLGCENNIPAWPDMFGNAVRAYLEKTNSEKIRTLSLFSGAGGLDIGFHDVGFDIIESVEIESKFCKTLTLNSGEGKRFEHAKVNCIDIREYKSEHLGRIDFIIGGPPCQTFSAAGRRANGVLGTTDARGVLFREYVRLLQELSPVGFLFENVYGIIGAQGGKPWEEILQSFSDVGYKLFYRIVDAADYGAPQHRERLIIVGLREGEFKFPRPTHGPDSIDNHSFYNAETAVEGLLLTDEESKSGIGGRYGSLLNDIPPGLNYSFYTEKMGHPNPVFAWRSKFSDFLYKADPSTPVRTIKASGGAYTGPFHWSNRFFSLGEYKRLQTFPDDYEISGTKQVAVKQIGNSVPPQLGRMMAIAIRQQIFNTVFPFKLPLLNDSEQLTFRNRKRELTAVYKKKAEIAIKGIKENHSPRPENHLYYCSMTDNFDFKETTEEKAEYVVDVHWDELLKIDIKPLGKKIGEYATQIMISPAAKEWGIGVSSVVLTVFGNMPKDYTVAWKAFDHELVINSIKADIIQLNGYYQYTPKIKSTCILPDDFPHGDIVSKIVCGDNVSGIKSSRELALDWGISEESLGDVAEFLRKLGYEIRNHNTNPQIEEGCWLIPYSFPTLTPRSVQLRKKVK